MRRVRPDLGRWLLILAAAAMLAACAGAPPLEEPGVGARQAPPPIGPVVLARDQDFLIVIAEKGDTLASLAERYLGDARKAWVIADFNAIEAVKPGQDVVIPLRPRGAVGVQPAGVNTVAVLCYHRFGSNRGKLSVTPAAFEQQMDYLARNGYRVITLAQVAGFLSGSEPIPRKAVVITIDDGYRSTYEVAYPILKKYGFPATVLLYSDFVGYPDALTWAQMQEMTASGLIEIQPHSKTHSNLAIRLPKESEAQYRDRVRNEIETPAAAIRSKLDVPVQSYAFPYGDANEVVTDLLTRNGVRLGLTVTPGGNPFYAYPLMLRRTMVFGEDDLAAFRAKLTVFSKTNAR